jgi:hypothetical protein
VGYYITQQDSKFFIPKELFGPALATIKELMQDTDSMVGGSWNEDGTSQRWFAWVSTEEVMQSETLKDALWAWRWEAFIDDNGDIADLSFQGEKSGQEAVLFEALSPHVKEGSYICMRGEDGEHWRWFFRDNRCIEQSGRIVYE